MKDIHIISQNKGIIDATEANVHKPKLPTKKIPNSEKEAFVCSSIWGAQTVSVPPIARVLVLAHRPKVIGPHWSSCDEEGQHYSILSGLPEAERGYNS